MPPQVWKGQPLPQAGNCSHAVEQEVRKNARLQGPGRAFANAFTRARHRPQRVKVPQWQRAGDGRDQSDAKQQRREPGGGLRVNSCEIRGDRSPPDRPSSPKM